MKSTPRPNDIGLDGAAPEWVNSWMPQRHNEIAAQIEKLRGEAALLESLGRLLCQGGGRSKKQFGMSFADWVCKRI